MIRYEEYVKSDDFKKLLWNHNLDFPLRDIYDSVYVESKGDLTVTGDLIKVTREFHNHITADVVYDNHRDALFKVQKLILEADNPSVIDMMIKINIPSKVTLKLEPANFKSENSWISYKIAGIIDINDNLKFPHWICPECGKNYGITPDVANKNCLICSDSSRIIDLVQVRNFYDGSFYKKSQE